MWTSKNRRRYDRSRLRYPSDLTDEEWALVEPLIAPAKRGGNRRHVVVREVVNGLMYILSTGCHPSPASDTSAFNRMRALVNKCPARLPLRISSSS